MQNNDSRFQASDGREVEAGATELKQLQEQVEELQEQVVQSHEALETRMVIEQAKGAISARCDVPVDEAFEVLRANARSNRRSINELAAEVIANRGRVGAKASAMSRKGGSPDD